jgi:hypothetical protein
MSTRQNIKRFEDLGMVRKNVKIWALGLFIFNRRQAFKIHPQDASYRHGVLEYWSVGGFKF